MLTIVAVVTWLFLATHVDAFAVLLAFSTDDRYRRREVFAGHVVGSSLALLVAILAAVAAAEFLGSWTFLLGLVPIAIGLFTVIRRRSVENRSIVTNGSSPTSRFGLVAIATVGVSGENLAVFVPFLATLSASQLAVAVIVYLVGIVAVYIGAVLVARRAVAGQLPGWVDDWFVPAVLILVGGYVVATGWIAG